MLVQCGDERLEAGTQVRQLVFDLQERDKVVPPDIGLEIVFDESEFVEEKIASLGTAACPPYHLAFCIGGLSAEMCVKTVKMASTKYYDNLHTSGNELGRAFRDVELEDQIKTLSQEMGIGAQFGVASSCHTHRVDIHHTLAPTWQ